jgi:hypothetical protein
MDEQINMYPWPGPRWVGDHSGSHANKKTSIGVDGEVQLCEPLLYIEHGMPFEMVWLFHKNSHVSLDFKLAMVGQFPEKLGVIRK